MGNPRYNVRAALFALGVGAVVVVGWVKFMNPFQFSGGVVGSTQERTSVAVIASETVTALRGEFMQARLSIVGASNAITNLVRDDVSEISREGDYDYWLDGPRGYE